MKTEFEKQLNQLLGERKERTLLMTDDRYNELVAETKEANARRHRGLELSGIHYRRLKRFDVMMIAGREILIQKNEKGQGSEKLHFCMASEMFDVVHRAHLKIGHKKEKGMELELKRKYCNITREVIAIYLSLCQDCALKKKYKVKGLSVKSEVESEMSSSCQIDIINMEAKPDGRYKFILNYQDQQSKFLILRPLETKTAEEVADVLFDIFCLIGVSNTLLCDNEHDFYDKVLDTLDRNWNVKLEMEETQQEKIYKISQDIQTSLAEWMSDNRTLSWASSLRIIQSLKNRSFHQLIRQTPHDALFGNNQRNHPTTSCPNPEVSSKTQNEVDLKDQLTQLKKKLDEVNKITKEMMENLKTPSHREEVETPKDNEIKCLTCNRVLMPEVFCWKCNGPLHFNCALTNDSSENPFCQLCASRTAVKTYRIGRKRRREEPLVQESPSFLVGDKVMVSEPEMESDSFASRKTTERQTVGTKNAILERLFYRNESGAMTKAVSPPIQMAKGSKGRSDKSKSSSSKRSSKRHSKSTQCNL